MTSHFHLLSATFLAVALRVIAMFSGLSTPDKCVHILCIFIYILFSIAYMYLNNYDCLKVSLSLQPIQKPTVTNHYVEFNEEIMFLALLAPRIFPVLFALVKPFLREETKRKIKILGGLFYLFCCEFLLEIVLEVAIRNLLSCVSSAKTLLHRRELLSVTHLPGVDLP